MANIVEELYSKIDQGREGRNIGLKTGLPKLDLYTGGFQKGVYKLVFGNSGAGKSSFVIYTDVYRVLKDYPDKDVLHVYFSLEMSAEVLLAKLLSLYLEEEYGLEVPFMDLMSIKRKLPDHIYSYILQAKEWLDSISEKIIIFDKPLSAEVFNSSMMEIFNKYGKFTKVDGGKRTIYTPNNPEKIINIILDHAGLCTCSHGRSKKEEIDLISSYCVRFREVCGASIDFIMQENRNASNMDRRKADLSESTVDDIKDSGSPQNDCTMCLAVYFPLKYQLTSYRGYRILDSKDGGLGLGGAVRGILLLKNRFGNANKAFVTGFQGSIGKFVELPKPDEINYDLYQSWKEEKEDEKRDVQEEKPQDFKKLNFKF